MTDKKIFRGFVENFVEVSDSRNNLKRAMVSKIKKFQDRDNLDKEDLESEVLCALILSYDNLDDTEKDYIDRFNGSTIMKFSDERIEKFIGYAKRCLYSTLLSKSIMRYSFERGTKWSEQDVDWINVRPISSLKGDSDQTDGELFDFFMKQEDETIEQYLCNPILVFATEIGKDLITKKQREYLDNSEEHYDGNRQSRFAESKRASVKKGMTTKFKETFGEDDMTRRKMLAYRKLMKIDTVINTEDEDAMIDRLISLILSDNELSDKMYLSFSTPEIKEVIAGMPRRSTVIKLLSIVYDMRNDLVSKYGEAPYEFMTEDVNTGEARYHLSFDIYCGANDIKGNKRDSIKASIKHGRVHKGKRYTKLRDTFK